MKKIHLKGKIKSGVTWLCVISLIVGLFAQAGPIANVVAAKQTTSAESLDESVREWYVYGDDSEDTGLVVTNTTGDNRITSGSISDAGVNLPDGLTESNFNLQVKVTVEGDNTAITTLNNASDIQLELANELYDCAELSWPYRNFVAGSQTLTFAFKDAAHTNNTAVNGKVVADNKSPFDWQETINWFRFYQTAATTGLKITVNEIKIVYADHGLTFGDDDTYLKLDSVMSETPKVIEATVNMPTSLGGKSWTIHKGTQFSTINSTVGSYTTVEGDAPGTGMECFVLDASGGAISGFEAQMHRLTIDAGAYAENQLAVSFWVWSNTTGKLGGGTNHFRISSNLDNVSGNALYYSYNSIDVKVGWNYIELPLNDWKPDIKEEFKVSNINSFAFLGFELSQGEIRRFGDFKLIVLGEGDAEKGWTLHSASTTTHNGQLLATGVTGEDDAPGAGMTYSILDASGGDVSNFATFDSVDIDISQYEKNELAVAFWVYANAAGTLGNGDNFRISSGTALSANFLHYQYSAKSISAGWNYVVLPLSTWYDQYNFDWKTIKSFGFTSYGLSAGNIRYFGDIKLIDLTTANEWQICTGASPNVTSGHDVVTGKTTAADGPETGMDYFTVDASSSTISNFNTRITKLGINAGKYSMDEVSLTFWVYANEAGTLGGGDHFRFSSNADNINSNLIYYTYSQISVEEGWNYIELPLSDWSDEAKGNFSIDNISSFGFLNYTLPQGQVRKFADFKLIVSGKGANWTLCNTSTTYNNNYGLSYTAGSVSGNEKEPEVGTNYAKIEVPKYNASVAESGKFGFELPSMPAFDVSANPSDYAVGFWFYSSTGMIPSGQFELNSSGGANDGAELHWYPQNWNIQKGWNYITLNMGAYASDSTPANVDFGNINYLRWYSDTGAQVTQDTVFAISDIILIKAETNEVVKTLCKAENQPLWYGLSKTICTMKEGPSAGTSYMETTVPGYTGEQPIYKSCFGFFTPFASINASAYEASNLTVSMWVYTATGKLPGGQIEINSSGAANDGAELVWFPNNFNSQLQIGWNKLELNLGKPHHTGGSGIDLSNINYIRWYTDENESVVAQSDTTFRIGEIKLYADTVAEGDILVTQNAKVTSGNYMIFSNANKVKEANPFAVFVTGEGYPSVLCGTTQFTLTKNICTGADVTLKVVRTNAGAVKFYIDGQLAGTSKTVAAAMGAPTKKYSIGADGKGNQVFVGTIKDVKAYSNVAATKCIGNWPLIGDIKYVTETMPDISSNENDAHFAGSRADDWYTVGAADADAGEWSLVYIPDTSQRFYNGQHGIYHEMTKWIAKDVTEFKHDNIKYVVGDRTNDFNGQGETANVGFEFFETSVPSSNLNKVSGGNHTFYRFQAGDGVKWMVISLDVYDAETAYTYQKEIMTQYPNDNVIVATDLYTSAIINNLNDEKMQSRVKLIISGGIAEGDSVANGVPAMILQPWNDAENTYFNGEQHLGLLYVLRFTDNGTKVTARSFAPVYGKYFDDAVTASYGTMSITTETEADKLATSYDSATGGVEPSNVPAGYKFAGWYQQYEEALAGKNYAVYDGREGAQTFVINNTRLGINAGAYADDDLAIQFWVYANADGKLAAAGDHQLRIASYEHGVSSQFQYWSLQNIDVKKGWNLISLPLNSRAEDLGFDKSNFHSIGFTSFAVAEGDYRYITDIELVVLSDTTKRWTLRLASDTSTTSGQTLTTGVTDGYALPLAKGKTGSNVYAKYVDADVLGVKAQVLGGTYDKSNFTNIRFLTSVDSLDYKEMGFYITLVNPYKGPTENDAKKYAAHNYVYENILAMNNTGEVESYKADTIFASDSKYFKAFTIKNVPNWAFSEAFTVQPYWITLDGTTVYGDEVDKSVWMGYPTNYEYLPQIVNTTYETEDIVIATIIPTVEKYGYNITPDSDEDCTAELQRALNDCHNMGGGTVYLPEGSYNISGSLTIPSQVTLRGDWDDADGTDVGFGTCFYVDTDEETLEELVDENGNPVNRNADSIHNKTATFLMSGSSGVIGINVYYPNQNVDDVIVYPYTFYAQADSVNNMLITLKDITVYNGYRGIGTSYEKQHECIIIDNFKGTFLDCGMALYNASDAGRVTGVSISSKYWNDYDGIDSSEYVRANATGMEIGDLEWQQFSDCSIEDCKIGISIVGGYRINFAGEMIDMQITDCTTGFTIADKNDDVYYYDTSATGKTEYPLDGAMDRKWGSVIARSTISASGNAIENHTTPKTQSTYTSGLTVYFDYVSRSSSLLRLTGSDISGNIVENIYNGYRRTSLNSTNHYTYNVMGDDDTTDLSAYDAQYDATYEIPVAQKKNLWVVDLSEYDEANVDVSEAIQDAIDEFKASSAYAKNNGGILYIPGGTYRLDNPITIPAGVELRGASAIANREQFRDSEGTLFMCYYGDDSSSSASDKALVTLEGDYSGVNGVRFLYPENVITYNTDTKSTYTISASNASNVHVVNTFIAASSYGVNFTNCTDFWAEGVYTCCYLNSFNASNSSGVIRGCLSNPNMIARTSAKGITAGWPTEAVYNDTTAIMNTIRNNLMNNLKYITISGSSSDEVLVQDITAYAVNRLVETTGASVVVLNANADAMLGNGGYQFYVNSGSLTVINALRSGITTEGKSTVEAYLYNSDTYTGTVKIYNSMSAKGEGEDEESAYEENTVVSN